ncbi:MAG: hypothetical protein D6795_04535 [Deltaproteobacteria bacterium]|nr:MAG: hypothetical protein D6795_04535 [Deltaproteobacteria bacterium]
MKPPSHALRYLWPFALHSPFALHHSPIAIRPSPFAHRHSPCPFQPLIDQPVEGDREREVDQLGRRVESPQILAFGGEGGQVYATRRHDAPLVPGRSVGADQRLVEERLVDRAEFLHAQLGVVHPLAHAAGTHVGERVDRLEELFVLAGAGREPRGAGRIEELPVVGEDPGLGCALVEDPEGDLEPLPEVPVARIDGPGLGEPDQARDAVGVGIDPCGREHLALLGEEEEEEPVDHDQQLVVEPPSLLRIVERRPQLGIEEPLGERLDRNPHLALQLPADLDPLLAALPEEDLEGKAPLLVPGKGDEAAPVRQTVERAEGSEVAGLENGVEVETDESLDVLVVEVAQDPEVTAVGNDPPERGRTVEVALKLLVGRTAAASGDGTRLRPPHGRLVEILPHQEHRRSTLTLPSEMTDGKTVSAILARKVRPLKDRLEVEELEERDQPLLAQLAHIHLIEARGDRLVALAGKGEGRLDRLGVHGGPLGLMPRIREGGRREERSTRRIGKRLREERAGKQPAGNMYEFEGFTHWRAPAGSG